MESNLQHYKEVNSNIGLGENVQNSFEKSENVDDQNFEFTSKLQETLKKLLELPISVSELKQPDVKLDIVSVYIKLCKALNVPINSAFLSFAQSDKLILSHQSLGPVGVIPVAKALIPCKTMKEIDLSYNNIGVQGLPSITLLGDRNENNTHLNLSNNEISKNSGKQLGALIVASSSLESLNLSWNDLGDQEIMEIGTAMMEKDKIRELNLSNNDIGWNVKSFGSSIANCSTLEKLDLSNNHLGEGIIGVFGSLKKSNMKYLYVSGNGIPDEPMSVLAVSLRKNKCLLELDLSKNCITDKGVNVLSSSLKRSTTLQKLKLANNHFQGSSAHTVLTSIGPNLEHLDLTGIKVKMAFIKMLKKFVADGRHIEVLYGAGLPYDLLPKDCHLNSGDDINESNVLNMLQKMADKSGVSLRNVLKSIHASSIIQKTTANKKNKESEEVESTQETRQTIQKEEFAKRLANSQIALSKEVAQDIATACSKDGQVNMWELISSVKWRPDDLLVRIKESEADKEDKKKNKSKGKKK
ncbi:hypothetical protein JTE90_024954 [Oedothorax gibbosus]|uniref:Uncharacterized protein n=1 Tax=Oedothorax gibbosus TaxID=931172 RepID=A0AAV6VWJ7_9ARAC|nr:hypothetical protein JTE90_024954 [Oedothorax gibbosus]